MPSTRYAVEIDWDGDGVFDGPHETLTRDVLSLRWALGLDDPSASIAVPASAEVVLRDPSRRYTPENASGPLYGSLVPRKKLRITSTYGGVTRTHFTGWIERISPRPERTVLIRAAGVEALLQRAEVFLSGAATCTADEVIGQVLAKVAYPPALLGYWMLGTARLGGDTRLPDASTYAALETGRIALTTEGQGWTEGASAWAVIRAVVEAERGLCFSDREGRLVFWNRHHLRKPADTAATFRARDAEFALAYAGADMVNRAEVTCHPRAVSDGPVTLWTLTESLRLLPGQTRIVRARFDESSGLRVGGQDLIPPEAGVDYHANRVPDGTGIDLTSGITVSVDGAGSSAELMLTNNNAQTVYLLAGATLRGMRITDQGVLTAAYEDQTSITLYGRRVRRLDLPLLADPTEAERLARHLVVEGITPRGRVTALKLRGDGRSRIRSAMLGLTVGDAIRLEDARAGHAQDYRIAGERHTLRHGGTAHETVWTLVPAPPLAYWQLGASGAGALGQSTRLVY